MTVPQEAVRMPLTGENAAPRPFPPGLLELKRTCHFYRFLCDEMETCRTDTERDVVLSALLTAYLKIRRRVKELGLPWAIET